MASHFNAMLHLQPIKANSPISHRIYQNPSISFPFLKHKGYDSLFYLLQKPTKSKIPPLSSVHCSSSSISPPASKEEAILQAKTCLSTALEKPLNNPLRAGKFKKLKQPRLRVEIPVVDDESPESLSLLALQIFGDMLIKRKGSAIKILILWPNPTFKEAGIKTFKSYSIEHMDISSVSNSVNRNLTSSADFVVFMAPEISQLTMIKMITDIFYPKAVAIFNPRWGFDEEQSSGELRGFVDSFDVLYSFTGLEVRGILSKKKGVIFRCVGNGEGWSVLVEEEGDFKVISRFKSRPSIGEVENVLYNLMAINSPVTKSAKFLKDLVSNVTGKRWLAHAFDWDD